MTNGRVATARSEGMFYCPARASEINSEISDASHFYIAHEYGLLATHSGSKKLADCWAAHKLAASPKGVYYIKQWIKHWRTYGKTDAAYGAPEQRISNVRSCCACGDLDSHL